MSPTLVDSTLVQGIRYDSTCVSDRSAYSDPARFAASLRKLASRAHQVLKDPTAGILDLVDLLRQIDHLQRFPLEQRPCDLSLWLESLHRRVKAEHRRSTASLCQLEANWEFDTSRVA
jgi:hypothetical protein